jgi:POT family proton-dependent oligopeptide transporter
LGQRKSVIVGGFIMALGQFAQGTPYEYIAGYEKAFLYLGLGLIIIGNGFFKSQYLNLGGRFVQSRR